MSFVLFGIANWGDFLTDLLAFFSLYLAISISLNLEMGYGGIPNFGKVLYFAAGSAFAGEVAVRVTAAVLGVAGNPIGINNFIMVSGMSSSLANNVPLSVALIVLTLVVGGAVGGAIGYISIFPAIRLREDYLAMLLLGAASFFQLFLSNYPPVIDGLYGIGIPNFFAWAGDNGTLVVTLLITGFAALTYLYAERVARSPLGRTLRAMRDNEDASSALGKDNVALRRNVLIVAAIITGVAGALYTLYTQDANPLVYDRVTWTFWPWLIVILGGAANNFGVSVGTFVFVFLLKFIDVSKYTIQSYLPFDVTWLEYIAFGSLLILVLLLRPGGIFPEKSSSTLSDSEVLSARGSGAGAAGPPSAGKEEGG